MEKISREVLNPNWPRRFCKFSKNLNKNFEKLISPQLRIPEERTIARLKGLVLGFHFAQVSPFFVQKKTFSPDLETFTFSNACAIQINRGTKERLKQKCAREYGLLAKRNKN